MFKRIWILCAGLWLSVVAVNAHAKDELAIVYEPSNKYDSIRQALQSSASLQDLIDALNEDLKLPKGLKIVFGDDEEAAYDPETNKITMPYGFVDEIQELFTQAKADIEGTPTEATIQTVMYMLVHEVAHALIDHYQLPVVGKEEDASDGLANVILTEYFENGQDAVLDAATFFDLVSADRTELTDEDFWDEHSLDEQRLYNALCYVYGSDPKKYAQVRKVAGFPSERAELCEEEYAQLVDSWATLLAPYVKNAK